jgi:hypothetical protein
MTPGANISSKPYTIQSTINKRAMFSKIIMVIPSTQE